MRKKDMSSSKPRLTQLVEKIQKEFLHNPDKYYTAKKMASVLRLREVQDRLAIKEILSNLADFDFIIEPEPGFYRLRPQKNALTASEENTFVGRLEWTRRGGYVVIDNHKLLKDDIFIPTAKLGNAQHGEKVVVRLTKWSRNMRNPEGEIIDCLGIEGENDTEMHAILAEFGLPYSYPKELEAEADLIPNEITPKEIRQRKDMRKAVTFTIDPRDAKDFDDALSIEKTGDGRYQIGVHIADVTHYVRPGSGIDNEAYKRATSVYLVDRTIPMLPEHLCNEVCSLRPDEDKLCFSVVFTMNDKAEVLNYEICRTVIRSNRRFTYEEAQAIIETGTGDYTEAILTLNRLAQILRQRRFDQGAIAFEREEVRFEIDEKGKPLSVYYKEPKESNQLIEEFMLLANRTVAQHIGSPRQTAIRRDMSKTFVYRVHDLPDPEKLRNFSQFIKRFGYNLKTSAKAETNSKNINKLLHQAKGSAEQNLIETLAVRSMAKAVYSTDNIGHYGLALRYYTHFTSPIRRYPDMMVHRLLERYLAGGSSVSKNDYEEKCKHCSDREQLAASAERASNKYKQVEYMSERIGNTYSGIISGVTEWGIYVELEENKCEGMISIRELDPHDYFIFDEKEYCVEGARTGKRYQLGDRLTVRVKRADLRKKQLDFSLVESDKTNAQI